MILLVAILFGVVLLVAPLASSLVGQPLPALPATLSMIAGAVTLVGTSTVAVMVKLYRRTKASEAFVRTGSGGVKVVRDGGAVVVPFVHELIVVSLETLKLRVVRKNEDAMITEDKLRADIEAEFFVRVSPDRDSILQAARSLGERMGDADAVKALVEDKLVSALRTAAAGKTLEQLNAERDAFLSEVMKLVAEDLRSNGLILETVTISKLDQTDERFLKEENIFDAQGRRKIAEITQVNLTERNRLVREGEEARKAQNVQTQQALLMLEQREREAAARQRAEVAMIEAETARDANTKAIDAKRQVELAALDKARAIEVAQRNQQEAVEVAERVKQAAVARAERERAAEEKALAEAETERERARQQIETVRVTELSEREKVQKVLAAQAEAERAYVTEQRRADAEAYARQKAALAQKAAADAEAEALQKRALAEAEAARLQAAGEQARAMVPIEVRRADVAVDRERLETVVKPELEARDVHGKVAQDFELDKLRIEADRVVRVEMAKASAHLFSRLEAKLYGSPEDVRQVMGALVRGQSVAAGVDGFLEAATGDTRALVDRVAASAGELAAAVSERVAPQGALSAGTSTVAPHAAEPEAVDAAE